MGHDGLGTVPDDCPDFEYIGPEDVLRTTIAADSHCQSQVLDGIPPRSCGSGTDKCTIHTLVPTAQDSVNTVTYSLSTYWNSANYATLGAWDFGGTGPNSRPKLRYNDYDGPTGTDYKNPTGAFEANGVPLGPIRLTVGQNGHFNIDCAIACFQRALVITVEH